MNETEEVSENDPSLEALLNYLNQGRGFDFTGYKRSSLTRRIQKRMHVVGLDDYSSYVDHLEVHPDEFPHLFDTILINVTAFFRDSAAWERLAADIIPQILAGKRPEEPIRIWSAGCASGEEAYSLAMMFAEAMGVEPFRERIKIFATDVDEQALNRGRHAVYDKRDLENVRSELIEKYFEPIDQRHNRYCFLKELRRAVIFGRNDLIQDAPISRIDLLACRNTLMYFNNETQSGILRRFHFALDDRGYLFLGKAETMLTYSSLFEPIDLKLRLFSKVPTNLVRDHAPLLSRFYFEDVGNQPGNQTRLREGAFDAGFMAQVIIGANGFLAAANEKARNFFRIAPADVGRPLQDLQISYRPIELRSLIARAYQEHGPASQTDVPWSPSEHEHFWLDVHVAPLVDVTGAAIGASVTYIDATVSRQLKEQLESTNVALEAANEELQSINEELETTNEELQSTNEELETTNEELQSTNEELETMNEELQSTNEEIETVNQELNKRSNELNHVNAFLESILAGIRCGLVVVDSDMVVQSWNAMAEDLWGLRSGEVQGKNLFSLEMGLPVHELREPIRACLNGKSPFQEQSLEVRNRRGMPFRCRITFAPMRADGQINGAILLMEEDGSASGPVARDG